MTIKAKKEKKKVNAKKNKFKQVVKNYTDDEGYEKEKPETSNIIQKKIWEVHTAMACGFQGWWMGFIWLTIHWFR